MTLENNGRNGWGEYRRAVIGKLATIDTRLEKIETTQIGMREDLAALKIKSGIWGLVGGLIPVLVALGIAYITGRLN